MGSLEEEPQQMIKCCQDRAGHKENDESAWGILVVGFHRQEFEHSKFELC
jgi:hypothetical protein